MRLQKMLFKEQRNILVLLCFTLVLILAACSNQKKAITSRAYHNTTSRFNPYFNGKESFRLAIKKLEQGHKEDYTQLLPVYILGDQAAASAIYPDMDRAVQKGTKVIQSHSIFIKDKEYNNWVDNSYILIGKSYFYKKEYDKAIESLDYVTKAFKDKKERFEAMLWLSKTYIEQGNYAKATSLIESAKTDPEIPKKIKKEIYLAEAHLYIKQERYAAGAVALKKGVELEKNKKNKARLTYLLAQISEKTGDYYTSTRHYSEVIKLNPPYEMAFYAQINRALAISQSGGNSSQIKLALQKMLKDTKNKEYFDQIYFALAEIEWQEKNKAKAVEYYTSSVSTSLTNTKQKGISAWKLAEIYYNDKNYKKAQTYYDTTVTFFDQARMEYPKLVDKRNSLTKLVKDILVVEREDSLQNLAAMPEKDRLKAIDKIISDIVDEENQKALEQQQQNAFSNQPTQQQQNNNSGGWYFYNPTTISFGAAEFKKKFGTRKLEDHWRRKNKALTDATASADGLDPLMEKDTTATAAALKTREFYLKNIPKSKEQIAESDKKIIDALYDMGIVYKEQIQDKDASAKAFEDLISRYDTSIMHLPCYYQLFRHYTDAGNNTKADYYKNLILTKYPTSKFAKALKNPDYSKELSQEKELAEKAYKEAYRQYQQRSYQASLATCSAAIGKYPSSPSLPNLCYLEALNYGALQNTDTLKLKLEGLVTKYPETEVGKTAKETLALLETPNKEKEGGSTAEKKESPYHFNPDGVQYFMMVMKGKTDINKIKNSVSDFNAQYYRAQTLKISANLVEKDVYLLYVQEFENVFKVLDYYNTFKNNAEILKQYPGIMITAISNEDYPTVYKSKDFEGYQGFFESNYPIAK